MPPIRRLDVDIFLVAGRVVATFDNALPFDDGCSLSDYRVMLDVVAIKVGGDRDRRNKCCGNGSKDGYD